MESVSLEVLQNSRVLRKVIPCKRTGLDYSRVLSGVLVYSYAIECIRLLEKVMRVNATLPLSGTV